jgi:hypothetical protein
MAGTGVARDRLDGDKATICEECGSGILDGEHIANYECSQK